MKFQLPVFKKKILFCKTYVLNTNTVIQYKITQDLRDLIRTKQKI